MPASAKGLVALTLLAAAVAVFAADSADVAQMILTGYYDSECLNPLPQTSHPNPQKCSAGECCSRSDGTTSIKLVSCGLHINAVVYSDEKCESPIVKKSQQNGQIKLDLRKCNPTSGIFFAPGSFYKAECVVSDAPAPPPPPCMCCRAHSSCISPSCCLSRSAELTPPSYALKLLIPDTETGAREVPSGVQRHHQHCLRRNFCLHHLHERQGVPRHAPRHRAQASIRLIFFNLISSLSILHCPCVGPVAPVTLRC